MPLILRLLVLTMLLCGESKAQASPVVMEGSVGMEVRVFEQSPGNSEQARNTAALLFNPKWKGSFGADDGWEAVFAPYGRIDAQDSASRYVDLREANLNYRNGADLWRMGFDTVFWGVAESNHLIDIVNQVDPRADVDLEAKLGQPMVSYAHFLDDLGRIELFWLPYFRERPSVGSKSRQRLALDGKMSPSHGLGRFRRHDDWLARWSGRIADLDAGLYYFRGIGREADYSSDTIPDYRAIRQVGLDLQLPSGNNLWKLEALHRHGHGKPFMAYVVGGERTLSYPSGDVGLLLEWSRDHRDEQAPMTRFARNWFAGLRYRMNESGDAELLCGVNRDMRNRAWLYKIEFGRRIHEHMKLSLVARKIVAGEDSIYAPLRRDGNLQLTLNWHF